MARPRIKIVSGGTDGTTRVQYAERDEWIDISSVVSEITWHLKAGDLADVTLHIAGFRVMLDAEADVITAIKNIVAEGASECAT
jgi:hypothetical protein